MARGTYCAVQLRSVVTEPMAPSIRPKLTATTVVGRVTEIREWMGLDRTAFGKRIGSGYQLIYTWETGKKFPSFAKLLRVAKISGYKIGDITDGTEDADKIDYSEQDEGATPTSTEPMSRGDALAWVDDRDDIPERFKAKLRNLLRQRPEKQWSAQDLEDMLTLLEPGNEADSDAEAQAEEVTRRDEEEAERQLKDAGGQRPSSNPPPATGEDSRATATHRRPRKA